MAVSVPADLLSKARQADPDPKIQLVLLAFAPSVPDLDMGAMARTVRDQLAAGATLWDATATWSEARGDACALLRKMQVEGVEGVTSAPSWGKLLAVALIVFLLRRR